MTFTFRGLFFHAARGEMGMFRSPERVTFSPPKKSPKSRQNLRFWNPFFAGHFMKANQVFAPLGTLFFLSCTDSAMCRLPAGTTFLLA